MAKLVLIFLFITSTAHADLFDFGKENGGLESKIPSLVEKLKSLEMKDGPGFEETFNQTVKAVENSVEEEKLFCSGEASDASGKVLPSSQKQFCMRELKKNYLEAQTTIFEMKKKYLEFIHQQQLQKLSEIQKKLRSDIEKNF